MWKVWFLGHYNFFAWYDSLAIQNLEKFTNELLRKNKKLSYRSTKKQITVGVE